MGHRHYASLLAHRGTDRREGEPQFLAIAPAEKIVVECVGLHMRVISIRDAAKYSSSC